VTYVDEFGRPHPPENAGEVETLLGLLDFQRATFAWRCRDLDAAALGTTVAASTMTLGGMLKHLTGVEHFWFAWTLRRRDPGPPWNAIDFDADPDWDWRTAADDAPDELRENWQRAVEQARGHVADALAEGGLDQPAKHAPEGSPPSLRWILCHMIEEYARHNGHADLIRESIDGQTGE
jgi:uncharacterized damage-inducible protein DinB